MCPGGICDFVARVSVDLEDVMKLNINSNIAVEIANRLCDQMHQVAREDESRRGDFEVTWIAGCVLAARFYADAMGLESSQVEDLIQMISKFESVARVKGEPQ